MCAEDAAFGDAMIFESQRVSSLPDTESSFTVSAIDGLSVKKFLQLGGIHSILRPQMSVLVAIELGKFILIGPRRTEAEWRPVQLGHQSVGLPSDRSGRREIREDEKDMCNCNEL